MKKFSLVCYFFLVGCNLGGEKEILESSSCDLSAKTYSVHSVSYDQDSGEYDLIVMGAPSCFKNPLHLSSLKLGRISDSEKENAIIDLSDSREASLLIAPDFQINMRKKVTVNGRTQEQSSSWTPFLTGAAGALAGSFLMNKMFRSPQYVAPPPMKPGQKNVRGVGGYGSTKKEAVKSYQRKYPGSTPTLGKKSFFRKSSVSRSSSNKRSFFKSRPRSSGRRFFGRRRR
jgi:hypothetical protein